MAFKKKEVEETKPESKQEPAPKEDTQTVGQVIQDLVNNMNFLNTEVIRLREDLDWLLRTLVTRPQIAQSIEPEEVDLGIEKIVPKKFEDVEEPAPEPVVEKMVKVEMLSPFSTGDTAYKVGDVVPVSQSFADTLVKSGLAKLK